MEKKIYDYLEEAKSYLVNEMAFSPDEYRKRNAGVLEKSEEFAKKIEKLIDANFKKTGKRAGVISGLSPIDLYGTNTEAIEKSLESKYKAANWRKVDIKVISTKDVVRVEYSFTE